MVKAKHLCARKAELSITKSSFEVFLENEIQGELEQTVPDKARMEVLARMLIERERMRGVRYGV